MQLDQLFHKSQLVISQIYQLKKKKNYNIYQIIPKFSQTFLSKSFKSYYLSINPNNIIIHTQSTQIFLNSLPQIYSPNQTNLNLDQHEVMLDHDNFF